MERESGTSVTGIPAGSTGGRACSSSIESRALVLYVWEESLESGMETVAALREAGYRVDMIPATAFRCRRVMRDNRLKLVLFDISAPDSLALCRRLRRIWRRAILVILRGQACTAVMQAFAAGADMWVLAPFDKAELVARVDALLRRLEMS